MIATIAFTFNGLTGTAQPPVSTIPSPSLGTLVTKMVLIIGVLALVAWYLRKRSGMSRTATSSSRHPIRKIVSPRASQASLRVLTRQTLGKGACLAVVEWEGRQILVGITGAGISFYQAPSADVPEGTSNGDQMIPPHLLADLDLMRSGITTSTSASTRTGVRSPDVTTGPRLQRTKNQRALIRYAPPEFSTSSEPEPTRPTFFGAIRELTVRR